MKYATYKLVIERNIPLPTRERIMTVQDVLRSMKVGDSTVFPLEKYSSVAPQCARAWGQGHYVMQKQKKGVRVWRVE